MPSIKDVARLAEVSTTTVSRVLSAPESVGTPLRSRVQQAIAQLGYRPNLAARRLRQRHASLIGLIVSDIRNPFFTDIGRAVEDIAYRNGLRLILCNTDEDAAKEQAYLELMADEQASGVIVSPTPELLRRFRSDRLPFPVVMVDRALDATPTDMVLLDNRASARRLAEHLLATGCRRIVALAGSRSNTALQRVAGFEEALQPHGLALRTLRMRPTVDDGQAAASALLAEPGGRPDAIVATNGLLLLGALRAVQTAGLRTPDDIMLAGFDNHPWAALPQLGLAVIGQPTDEIGRNAAELLLQRIADPARLPRRIVLEGELWVGGARVGAGAAE